MLAEFVESIRALANAAAAPKIEREPGNPRAAYVSANGTMERFSIPPPCRDHQFYDLASLIEFCNEFAGSMVQRVWHDHNAVTVVLDDDDRLDKAKLVLFQSPEMEKLAMLAADRDWMPQREFIRLLRHDLRDCGAEHLLSAVKRVSFRRTNDGRSNIEHGKESLGRSVEAEVNSAELIPEFVSLFVPVYSTRDVSNRQSVECTVEIDLQNERFCLLPSESSLRQAIDNQQMVLHEELVDKLSEIPVHYGQP